MEARKHILEARAIPNDEFFQEVCKLLSMGSSVEVRVNGDSMNPFFVSGRDSIVLSPVSQKDLVKGAFVLGRDTYGRWVAHRIVKVTQDYLILNGDGNYVTAIEHMKRSAVVALVTGYVRKGRHGSTAGFQWRTYSFFWRVAGVLGLGKTNIRRVVLFVWRLFHLFD